MRLVKRQSEKTDMSGGNKPRKRVGRARRPKQVEAAAAIVFGALPGIVDKLVEKALEGSVQHAKCVFEMARIAEVEAVKDEKPEPWVAELLSALRALPEGPEPTPSV
jgi:hypothetical protein